MKNVYSFLIKVFLEILLLYSLLSCGKHKEDEYPPPCICPPDFAFTDGEPAWSPDGKYIAFRHGYSTWARTGIYLPVAPAYR